MCGKQVHVLNTDHIDIQVKTKGLFYVFAGFCRLSLYFFSVPFKFMLDFNRRCRGHAKIKTRYSTRRKVPLYWCVPFIPSFAFSPFQRYTRFSRAREKRNGIVGVLKRKRKHFGGFHKIMQTPRGHHGNR